MTRYGQCRTCGSRVRLADGERCQSCAESHDAIREDVAELVEAALANGGDAR